MKLFTMQTLCAFVVCYVFVIALASRAYRSGFPKFPQSFCGSRAVQWYPGRESRVIGGIEPPIGALPWQIDLRVQESDSHHCGGSLVSSRLIITAAHCYSDELVAVAGAHGPPGSSPHEQVLKVERFIPHPDFRKLGPFSHDIAVLLVISPGFKINDFVKPACLSEEAPLPGMWCEVSGWGAFDPDDHENISPILKAATVPIISLETCRKNDINGGRQQQILDSMLCAGHLKGGTDACRGDSGGPLVCEVNGKMQLAGIVSWGDGCAKKNRAGVYTRVSSYLSWIREHAIEMGVEL